MNINFKHIIKVTKMSLSSISFLVTFFTLSLTLTFITFVLTSAFNSMALDIPHTDFNIWMIIFSIAFTIIMLPKDWLTDPENSFLLS